MSEQLRKFALNIFTSHHTPHYFSSSFYLHLVFVSGDAQVAGPAVSEDPSGLGVFGIPWEDGEETRNKMVPGVDDATVKLWEAPPQSRFDEDVVDVHGEGLRS